MKLKALLEANSKEGGYKSLASYVSKQTGKKISSNDIEKYLRKMEKEGAIKSIERNAKKRAENPERYKWGSIQNILVKHFS